LKVFRTEIKKVKLGWSIQQLSQTTAVHGITDDKVANEPTFKELAAQVYYDQRQ
jgi:hypothetical protein